MKFLKDLLKGIIIGIGAVAPGVSGGTFAVILGVYDKLTDAIANIFQDFYSIVISLLPLVLGIVIGVLGFSNILNYLFSSYGFQVKFLFIGLMLGSIDSVINEANRKGYKPIYLFPCIIALCITVLFMILENKVINIIPEANSDLINLIIYGGIIGFGTIVPGISSSFILMLIGAYEIIIKGIAEANLLIIIPVGIGFSISIILFAKMINILFKRFYGYTYYTVLGFVLGSIIIMIPRLEFSFEYAIGLVLCTLGYLLSHSFTLNDKIRK